MTFESNESYEICTVTCGGPGLILPPGYSKYVLYNDDNLLTPCQAYQSILMDITYPEILVYLHDDVTVHDPQLASAVLKPFREHPNCVAVGLGGATGLGNWNLHRQPYALRNMARSGYASNQTDAEVHGERFIGERRVAVLDAFCMAVRRDYLLSVGGWPTAHISHHCLDLWLACQAARDGKEIWMTGIPVLHSGGGTSTKQEYRDAKWLQGGTLDSDHSTPHLWLWQEYRDVLPIQV